MASGRSGGPSTGHSGRRAAPPRGERAAPPRGKNPVSGARRRQPQMTQRQAPWLLIGAIAVIIVLIVVLGYFLFARNSAVSPWRPSAENKDPSLAIPGIVTQSYVGQVHVRPNQRVAYDRSPPFGGPHDGYWAACNGVVYDRPVRNENMVHGLEHGAVWIAYDPARVQGADLQTLVGKVQGQNATMLSPYPGLDQPVSLQSWGHQLKVGGVGDERIDQFISSLRLNPNTYPEVGASCDALGPGAFDPNDPPPFAGRPYPRDALPMNYQGEPGATG